MKRFCRLFYRSPTTHTLLIIILLWICITIYSTRKETKEQETGTAQVYVVYQNEQSWRTMKVEADTDSGGDYIEFIPLKKIKLYGKCQVEIILEGKDNDTTTTTTTTTSSH